MIAPAVTFDARQEARGPHAIGLVALLSTVTVLFAAFTAALIVRRTGSDWVPVRLPAIVWFNAIVLLLSSAAVEHSRRAAALRDRRAATVALTAAALLGALFLAGQVVAWRLLAARGYLLPTNPHSAFFYTVSAVHGAHVIGGLAALLVTRARAAASAYRHSHAGVLHCAIYWHFIGATWLYLLILLTML